jgi:hypothetical protein
MASSPTAGGKSTTGGGKGQASGSKSPAVLQITPSVLSGLRDAYFMKVVEYHPKEKQANIVGPTETHYGEIGGVYYAIGAISFKDDPVSRQGGPHLWKSPNGSHRSYEGDTRGAVCSKPPKALGKAWGIPC